MTDHRILQMITLPNYSGFPSDFDKKREKEINDYCIKEFGLSYLDYIEKNKDKITYKAVKRSNDEK